MSSTPSTSRDPLAHERGIISRAMRQLPMQPGSLVTLADHLMIDSAIGRVLEIRCLLSLDAPGIALFYLVAWPGGREHLHYPSELAAHITQGGSS